MIVFAAVMAGVATANNPLHQPCNTPGSVGCGQASNINSGSAFIYKCSSTGEYVFSAGCDCASCCVTTSSGGAVCISQKA
ncbi:hypothetical protein EDB19DRAFT_1642742 [Suillus lakei]|nr:hypothetical protein EDB19DRAFT_1642742 [Suillus lakei]